MRITLRPEKACNTNWHRWFAWWPVVVTDDNDKMLVWLEAVDRRFIAATNWARDNYYWCYRLPEDL